MVEINQPGRVQNNPPTEAPLVRSAVRQESSRSEYNREADSKRPVGEAEVERIIDQQQFHVRQGLELHERLKEKIQKLEESTLRQMDKKEFDAAKQTKSTTKIAQELLRKLQTKSDGSNPKILKSIQEIGSALKAAQQAQAKLEKTLNEKPVNRSELRVKIATAKLERLYGKKIPSDLLKDPAQLRSQIVDAKLRPQAEKIAEAKQKLIEQEKLLSAKIKAKETDQLKNELTRVQSEIVRLEKTEKVYTQTILYAEGCCREIEKQQVAEDLSEGLQDFEENNEPVSQGSGALVQSSSAGQASGAQSSSRSGGLLETSSNGPDYEAGASDYVELNGRVSDSGLVGISSPISSMDLSGTTLAIQSSSNTAQEEWRKSEKMVQELIRRLAAGDLRVLELACIVVSHGSSMSTVQMASKMIKAMDEMDKSQRDIAQKLKSLEAGNPQFASQTAAANIEFNKIANDRNMTMNLMRTAMTNMEETQNFAKSVLDIRGTQARRLAQFSG